MPGSVGPGKPWKIMLISMLLLFASIAIYFGLDYGYKPMLTAEIRDRKDDLIDFYSQFVNLKSILDNHVVSSKIFSFLEQNTHEGIQVNSTSLDMKNRSLTLQGTASSFDILSAQGKVFESQEDVTQVNFDDVQNSDKGITFKIKLIFSNESFQ